MPWPLNDSACVPKRRCRTAECGLTNDVEAAKLLGKAGRGACDARGNNRNTRQCRPRAHPLDLWDVRLHLELAGPGQQRRRRRTGSRRPGGPSRAVAGGRVEEGAVQGGHVRAGAVRLNKQQGRSERQEEGANERLQRLTCVSLGIVGR